MDSVNAHDLIQVLIVLLDGGMNCEIYTAA